MLRTRTICAFTSDICVKSLAITPRNRAIYYPSRESDTGWLKRTDFGFREHAMLIEVFADFSCPWCFVGRRRLARAQAQRPQLTMQTVWQPFQLNPEIPAEGIDRRQRMMGKFGDFDRLGAMERALEESGGKD